MFLRNNNLLLLHFPDNFSYVIDPEGRQGSMKIFYFNPFSRLPVVFPEPKFLMMMAYLL